MSENITDRALDGALKQAKLAVEALNDAKRDRERQNSADWWNTDYAAKCLARALSRLGHDTPTPADTPIPEINRID